MYQVNERVVVPPDPIRWPGYPHGFVGQILSVEPYPAEPDEVWVMLAVVVAGRIQQARLVPIPRDLEPAPSHELVGPPSGYARKWVATR